MWFLALLITADSIVRLAVPLAADEHVMVTMTGAGTPVVMVPGLLGSAYAFRRLLPLLETDGFRAIIIEPLGIGGSARPRRADYSLTAQADRIAAVLDTLGVRQAIVLGHALSASIALRLALRRPDLVRGVIALDGGPSETAATKGLRSTMRFAPFLRLFGGKGMLRKKLHRQMIATSADTSWVTPEVLEGYTADAARDLGKTLDAFQGMIEAREPERLMPGLGRIRCPVRLVAGAVPHETAVPPAEIGLLRDSLPVFAIDSVPGVGHFAFEEDPPAVLASVRRIHVTHALALGPSLP